MADSGLILNFAAGDIPLSTAGLKFKGGPWRQRARLTKSAKLPTSLRVEDVNRLQQKLRDNESRRPVHPVVQDDAKAKEPITRQDNPSRGNLPAVEDVTNSAVRTTGHIPPERSGARRNEGSPAKRRRTDRDFKSRPFHLEGASFGGQPGNREVISSLFSYNPPVKPIEEQMESEPVKPSNAPLPDGIDTFTSLGLSEMVAAHLLTKMNLKNPTAIQREAVAQLTREDADVFIQSETGSGKTLAYLLPIVQRLITIAQRQKHEGEGDALHRDSGLFAIIIAPTRELCKQISVVLERLLGCAHFIVAGTVIGGEKKKSEKARLRKGLNILVATPGRLVDHLDNTKNLDVSNVRYFVLDEGDRLMDLGFEEDITKIVNTLDEKKSLSEKPGLPTNRITVLCSATLKANVEKLGDISLKDAVLVKGEKEDTKAFLAPAQLKQSYIICPAKLRLVTLTALLKRTFARKGSVMKAIVFFSCADSVEFHHKVFTREDAFSSPNNTVTVCKLHGSLLQQSRTATLKTFAASTSPSLLLATDVASRGLDLPNLDLVIEYDPAFSKDDHLHRIGRTARLGRDGRAVIFLMPSEEGYVEILRGSSEVVTANSATEVLKKGFLPNGIVTEDWEKTTTEFQLDVERWVLNEKDLAKNAFQSHVRAYATHISSERKYFDIKQLHLGHLAKAFGLRDPPGKVNVAGLRAPRANEGRKRADIDEMGDTDIAADRMRQMVRNQKKMTGAGADEFNIA